MIEIKQQMAVIKLWFYDPVQDPNGWINHCVSKCDPPFCHCEIQINNDQSYCIYMGTRVMRKQRSFDSPPYKLVTIYCSEQQKHDCVVCADQLVKDAVPFSTVAFLLAPVPLVPYWGTGTFCSKLCADILAAGGLLCCSQSDRDKLTPSALHRLLTARQSAMASHGTGTVMAIDFI